MNKTELVAKVAEKAEVSKKDAVAVVDATFAAIQEAMVAGDKVQLVGFGTFETRKRAARTAKNLQTGETIQVEAKTVPAFKPGKALKDALK